MVGAPSLLQTVLGFIQFAVQGIIYPLGIVIILLLAYLQFRKLVNHLVPSKSNEEEVKSNDKS